MTPNPNDAEELIEKICDMGQETYTAREWNAFMRGALRALEASERFRARPTRCPDPDDWRVIAAVGCWLEEATKKGQEVVAKTVPPPKDRHDHSPLLN